MPASLTLLFRPFPGSTLALGCYSVPVRSIPRLTGSDSLLLLKIGISTGLRLSVRLAFTGAGAYTSVGSASLILIIGLFSRCTLPVGFEFFLGQVHTLRLCQLQLVTSVFS